MPRDRYYDHQVKMAEEEKTKTINLTLPIIVILLMIASFLVGLSWDKIREEKQPKEEKNQVVQATPTPEAPAVLGEQLEPTNIGRFMETKDETCQEDGKPVVFMFGRSGCPYCVWEHPIFEKATAKFGNLIAVHDNMDKQGADEEIWQKYSQIHQGGVPFMLLGCRYAQRGEGDRSLGEAQEEKNITALICELTDGQPEEVCLEVKDLLEQIKD